MTPTAQQQQQQQQKHNQSTSNINRFATSSSLLPLALPAKQMEIIQHDDDDHHHQPAAAAAAAGWKFDGAASARVIARGMGRATSDYHSTVNPASSAVTTAVMSGNVNVNNNNNTNNNNALMMMKDPINNTNNNPEPDVNNHQASVDITSTTTTGTGTTTSATKDSSETTTTTTTSSTSCPTSTSADLLSAKQRLQQRLQRRRTNSEPNLAQSFLAPPPVSTTTPQQQQQQQQQEQAAAAATGNDAAAVVLRKPVPVRPVVVRPVPIRPVPLRPVPLRAVLSSPDLTSYASNNNNTNQLQQLQQLSQLQLQQLSQFQAQLFLQQQQWQQPQQQLPGSNWYNVPVRQKSNIKRSAKSIAKSLTRKYKRPSWYHDVAAKNRLGCISEDPFVQDDTEGGEEGGRDEEDEGELLLPSSPSPQQEVPTSRTTGSGSSPNTTTTPLQQAKQELLHELNRTGGESNTPAFHAALSKLIEHYDPTHFDPRKPVPRHATACAANQLEGIGIAAGKPTFPGCIGRTDQGDAMYKLGTMSFDMFCPTQLVVSVQGTFVLIDTVDGRNTEGVKNVPKNLLADVRFGRSPVRTYNIVTPFTIEPWRPEFGENSPNKGVDQPIRGVMTTYGFLLPYPKHHRFSVWFTGGSLEVDGDKNEKWFQIFDKEAAPKRTAVESSKLLAAKLLMGASTSNEMDQDGRLSYTLKRPIASHIDLLYLDKSLQVLRGSSGTAYVHVRLPGADAVQQSALTNEMLPAPVDPMMQQSDIFDDEDDYGQLVELQRGVSVPPAAAGAYNNSEEMMSRSDRHRMIKPQPMRRIVSESDLTQNPFIQEYDSAVSARLQELESYVVADDDGGGGGGQNAAVADGVVDDDDDDGGGGQKNSPATQTTKRSCLKQTSSYGDLENVPICGDRGAWAALPAPKLQQQEPPCKAKRIWNKIKRTRSDPSMFKDDDITETGSSDSDVPPSGKGETGNNNNEASSNKNPKLRKSVSFSCLEIRSYDCTVGDNPSCSGGPPISLDWTYQPETQVVPVHDYENKKKLTHFGRQKQDMRLSSTDRKEKLRKEFGVRREEIILASAEVDKVKHQREFTNKYMLSPQMMKVEGAVEAVQRKAKRVVNRLKPPRHDPASGIAGIA